MNYITLYECLYDALLKELYRSACAVFFSVLIPRFCSVMMKSVICSVVPDLMLCAVATMFTNVDDALRIKLHRQEHRAIDVKLANSSISRMC